MKLLENAEQFDTWQSYFSYELLREIREQLEEAGLPADKVRELTANIGFRVSCLIDASAEFSVAGEAVTPVLTFSAKEGVLVHQGAPSELHEYVFGNIDELFEE